MAFYKMATSYFSVKQKFQSWMQQIVKYSIIAFILFQAFSVSATTPFLTLPIQKQAVVANGWDYNGNDGHHWAIDYLVAKGTPVIAAADGYAVGDYQIENGYGYGKLIIIMHDECDEAGNNYFSLYAHLDKYASCIPQISGSRFTVSNNLNPSVAGWVRVKRGQVIGKSGDSGLNGRYKWEHLHFAIIRNKWGLMGTMSEVDPYGLYKPTTAGINSSEYYPPKLSATVSGTYRSSGSLYTGCGLNRLWITDPPTPPSFGTIYNFNNNNSEGWTAGNAISNQRFEDGKWVFNTSVDPYVISPRLANGITTGQFKKVEVSLSVFGDGRTENAFIYFDTGDGFNGADKFYLGEVPTFGQSQVYTVGFPQNVIDANKSLSQIRLDPLYSEGLGYTPNDAVKIDFIRLISDYHYWCFKDTPLGWSLGNAISEGFVGDERWGIMPTTGDPQLKSPWLGSVDTGTYNTIHLQFAVNRDQDSEGNTLPANIYFDFYDDGIEGFVAELHSGFNVLPDSKQHDYYVPIFPTQHCTKIHRIRVDFYESSADEKYLVYVDKIEFTPNDGSCDSPTTTTITTTSELRTSDTSTATYVTIHEIGDITLSCNSPVAVQAFANGCCSDEYNWSFTQNPLDLSIDANGHIFGSSGSSSGTYISTIRAEDRYNPTNFTEKTFKITVNSDANVNSMRIFNDGTANLEISDIYVQNSSSWVLMEPPNPLPIIPPGSYNDIFVSVDKQGLSSGVYNDNIIINSNDGDNNPVIIPISVQVDTDTSAPPAPQNLSCNPSSWFAAGDIVIDWDNPTDPSGITDAYYKIDSPPISDEDGIFVSSKPIQITPFDNGNHILYLWLVDGAGNKDFHNMNTANYYYDTSAPTVISKYPDNGATDVAVDTNIFVHLEDVHSGIEINSVVLKVNGVAVSPIITGSPTGYSVSYTPPSNFGYDETISISIEASDSSSPTNILMPVVWSFNTATAAILPTVDSFNINDGAASTVSQTVSLNNLTSGIPTEYMASELVDFSDATWQTYSTSPPFTLSTGNETKTVYFKVRNSVGESSVMSDTILLQDPAQDCKTLEVTAYTGSEIYTPPAANYQYHYGPSIILTGNIVDMWTSSPDPSPGAWDRIEHRRGTISSGGTIAWTTDWVSVLEATPNSRDRYSVCDPAVFEANGYYYIGYTSTDQVEGAGATSNDVFVARFDGLPDGSPGITCEKWNGTGWGGDPQPIIEYNGPSWGIGQPSFVVKDNILYVYYTDNGTKVATADITNSDWPLTLDFSADPILINDRDTVVLGGKPGPLDVKFIDDLARFIGVGVSLEFNPASNVFVYESLDGIHFIPVATSKDYWTSGVIQDSAHNIGLSGDSQGHMQLSNDNFIAYAYGRPNGDLDALFNANWPTYLNPVDMSLIQGNCLAAVFSADPVSGTAPLAVQFTDRSTGEINSYEWDFDSDGTVDSAELNPSHTYSISGTYIAKLTVFGSGGVESSYTRQINVEQASTDPVLNVITPAEGDTLYKGTDYHITWSAINYTGNIKVHVYKSGVYYVTVAASEPVVNGSTGLLFNVPKNDPAWPNGSDYQIAIATMDDQYSDFSGNFTIADLVDPLVTVTPSSGTQMTSFLIRGERFTPNGAVTQYMVDPSGIVSTISTIIADGAGGYVYSWTCPSTAIGQYHYYAVDNVSEQSSDAVLINVISDPIPPTFVVSPAINSVGSGAEILTLTVDTSGDNYLNWSASSDTDWLDFSVQPAGVGDGTFTVDVEINDGFCRTGTVVVTAPEAGNSPQIVTVNQRAADLLLVTPALSDIASAGGSLQLTIDTTGDNYVSWSAASESNWLSVAGNHTGTGYGSVVANVEPNAGFFRSGKIVVTSAQAVNSPQTFSVNQYPDDLLLLSPQQRGVAAAGASVTLSVETTGDRYVICSLDTSGDLTCRVDTTGADYIGWHATSDSDWLEISGDPYGVGFGSVVADVAANDGSVRSAHITMTSPEAHNSPQVFTVKQMGTNCTQVNQMAGLSAVPEPVFEGIFPKYGGTDWSGISLLNTGDNVANVTLIAYSDSGAMIAEKEILINVHGKFLVVVESFFEQDISLASYLRFSSDQSLTGFYMGGNFAGDIEALPIPLDTGEGLCFPALTTGSDWANEFALINTGTETINGNLNVFDSDGVIVHDETVTVSPFVRKHWTVSEIGASINLPEGEYTAYFVPTAQIQGSVGYVTKSNGLSQMSLPAFASCSNGDLYLPKVQLPENNMWQGLVLVNTSLSVADLSIEGDGVTSLLLTIPARGIRTVTVSSLFSGSETVYPNHLVVRNLAGRRISGYDLIGNDISAAAVPLRGFDNSMDIFYPHIARDVLWDTDFVAFNNSLMAEVFNLQPFDSSGNALSSRKYYLAGKESLAGLASTDLPFGTAWFKIESTGPVFGYELLKSGDNLCPGNPADLDGDQDGDGADLAELAQRLIDGNVSSEELEAFAAAFGSVR